MTTTDIHLPRRIGQALHSAYKGSLDVHYDEEGYFIRVHWSRRELPAQTGLAQVTEGTGLRAARPVWRQALA